MYTEVHKPSLTFKFLGSKVSYNRRCTLHPFNNILLQKNNKASLDFTLLCIIN